MAKNPPAAKKAAPATPALDTTLPPAGPAPASASASDGICASHSERVVCACV